jgi:hypothetical protein
MKMRFLGIIIIILQIKTLSAQEKVPQSLVDKAFKEIFSDTAESFYINEFEGFSFYYGNFTEIGKTECIVIGNEYWHTTTYGVRSGRIAYFIKIDNKWVYQSVIPIHFRIIQLLDINNDKVTELFTYSILYQSASSVETFAIYSLSKHTISPVFEWECYDWKNSMGKREIGDTLYKSCNYSFSKDNMLSLSFQYEIVKTVNPNFTYENDFAHNYTFSTAEEKAEINLYRQYAIAQKKARLTISH